MSLLTTHADASPESSRDGWLRLLLAGIASSLLFAFWLVCSQQVRVAESRQNEAVIQQMALSDCLQYVPGSTIASCNRIDQNATATATATADADAQGVQPTDDANPAMRGAVPVSFSVR
jgi:hypothetical protein